MVPFVHKHGSRSIWLRKLIFLHFLVDFDVNFRKIMGGKFSRPCNPPFQGVKGHSTVIFEILCKEVLQSKILAILAHNLVKLYKFRIF